MLTNSKEIGNSMLFEYIKLITQSPVLLLGIEICSSVIKLYLLVFLIEAAIKSAKIKKQLFLLLTVLIAGVVVDFSWIAVLFSKYLFQGVDFRPALFIIRIAWAVNFVLFLSLGAFIESLCEKNFSIKIHHKILFLICSPFIIYFVGTAFFKYNVIDNISRVLELFIIQQASRMSPFLLIPGLYCTLKKIKNYSYPKILKKQLKILINYLIFPYLFTQLMDAISIYYDQPFIVTGLSNAFLACGIYFSISKIMKFRFLNFEENIQSPEKPEFIDCFKAFLGSITKANSLTEIGLITQTYFKDSLRINPDRVSLHYRHAIVDMPQTMVQEMCPLTHEEEIIEKLINNQTKHEKILDLMKRQQILIYDEIEFSNFYQDDPLHQDIITFMHEINAEVFLPIFEHHNLIAYLIISKESLSNKSELFNNLEHDQMVILASYLGNIITMLQLNNYKELLAHNKRLQDHVYQAHQENNQYRESIQSFLRDNHQRQTGILFYKNYHFTFGNQAAKELIPINIHMMDGHPITKALKKLVKSAEEYKTSQSTLVNDTKGNSLVLTALPHLEKNNIIVTVAYPEISDVLKQQIEKLSNPSEWEYLLYLQTTQSGKLINRLIPGLSKSLLNFKIDLLRAALNKKALIIDAPDDDLEQMAELLHHISLRENIYKLTMNSYEKGGAIATKLFGMNAVFGDFEQALLERLNATGTLFIQNIHLLEMSTQESLAEFIKYGYYTVCKSNKRVFSDVRIMCSTTQNLHTLVQEKKFSKNLFDELNRMALTMPSLFSLSEEELHELIKEFGQQEVTNINDFQKLLEFTTRDKEQLMKTRSLSLSGLRKKINQLLVEKSKKHEIYHSITFNPASHLADDELAHALQLGKNALRDRKKLMMLMEKFDNNQNKVAAFLGVNRSSINRRLKAHKIEVYNDGKIEDDMRAVGTISLAGSYENIENN